MRKVFAISDNVISSLGFSTAENFSAMLENRSGIACFETGLTYVPEIFAASVPENRIQEEWIRLNPQTHFTRFERLMILSICNALLDADIDPASPETLFLFSTTKGNIELIEQNQKDRKRREMNEEHFDFERVHLWKSAQEVVSFFDNPNRAVIVSHACISGVSALITAKRYLENGHYKHAIVCGADLLSHFVIAGFNSLKALSPNLCKPYDVQHEGLNLGEGAATLLLSTDAKKITDLPVVIESGVTSNDANHISGPSRTGEGLYRAITDTMHGKEPSRLAFINAHGTATVYNDDMESIAINRAGLQNVLVSGFKGYLGHTLGAAGIIETVLSITALKTKQLPGTYGFQTLGTAEHINVSEQVIKFEGDSFLKTASGFGGCNAAILVKCSM